MCLNILREDWKPGLDDRQPHVSTLVYQDSFFVSVLTINSIVYGLQYLFLEPNPEDPLNKEAANELQVRRKKKHHYAICSQTAPTFGQFQSKVPIDDV